MRLQFVQSVLSTFEDNPKSLFLTGDLGYNALEKLAEMYPKRFLNAGVAEQNMVGLAAGMALSGYEPWVYSIAPFLVYRCFEQIRNDLCLHNLPVHLVGNGGGYTYGVMGPTHHALEDLGILKTLPHLRLYFPQTNNQVAKIVEQISQKKGPTYLRLSISGFQADHSFLSENPKTLTRHYQSGNRATVIGIGHAVQIALSALHSNPHLMNDADVFGISQFPFDLESDHLLLQSVQRTKRVILLDEHYQSGSLAESLASTLPFPVSVQMMTAQYSPDQKYGSTAFYLRQSRLTPEHLLSLLS